MYVAELALTDYRNHGAQSWSAGPGLVVLAGPNGAGKTNILEALSLLAPGRGLRGAVFADMARTGGGGGFSVSVVCEAHEATGAAATTGTAGAAGAGGAAGAADEAAITIGTGIVPANPGRRKVRVNGADAPANALAEWLALLWLTPAMDRLFVDNASQRRRFLDRLVLALHPAHAHHATRYEAAMRARNRLLADEPPWDDAWLTALEAQMAEHGTAIAIARSALITNMRPLLAAADDGVFARPLIDLISGDGVAGGNMPGGDSLVGDRSGGDRSGRNTSRGDAAGALPAAPGAERMMAGLIARLVASRRLDARAGRALVGPHRQDLVVTHAAKQQPAAQCSTGEQKAMLLAIILTHGDLVAARRGQRPILLLDELAAHLDPERRAALFGRLADNGGQVWMTGTEMALFSAVDPRATRIMV